MRQRGIAWRRWLMAVFLVVTALWLGSLIIGLGEKAQIAWQEAHQTESQYASLEARKAALQANLDILATARGQDAAIRQAFGVAKSGEGIIIVVPSASSTATTTLPWWQKLLNWF